MDLNIRLATVEDINNINMLFEKVIDDLHNVKKIDIWNEFYPFCEFKKNIQNKDMYVIEDDKKIVGSFTLIKEDDPDCHSIDCND